jgi:predicted DNA-binding transcriptional regulator AlpA
MSRLITSTEMAKIVGYEASSLRRLSVRQRLENRGCPMPKPGRPLRWSEDEVMQWVTPQTASEIKTEDRDKTDWRNRLSQAYGAEK